MNACPNNCMNRNGDIRVKEVSLSSGDGPDEHGYHVECACCHMTGPLGGNEAHAIRLWDELPRRRHPVRAGALKEFVT